MKKKAESPSRAQAQAGLNEVTQKAKQVIDLGDSISADLQNLKLIKGRATSRWILSVHGQNRLANARS